MRLEAREQCRPLFEVAVTEQMVDGAPVSPRPHALGFVGVVEQPEKGVRELHVVVGIVDQKRSS